MLELIKRRLSIKVSIMLALITIPPMISRCPSPYAVSTGVACGSDLAAPSKAPSSET